MRSVAKPTVKNFKTKKISCTNVTQSMLPGMFQAAVSCYVHEVLFVFMYK
jgi:hypothetical protein